MPPPLPFDPAPEPAQHPASAGADRILVFIPAYRCAPQIVRVLAQFHDVPAGVFDEVLVVDNGSPDGTAEAAIAAAQHVDLPVRVVRNADNYGLGGSHKSAFAYAAANGFTHVVVLHGDDQGSLRDVLPVLAAGLHRAHDACLGSRFMRGSRLRGYPLTRRLGNRVFNLLFSLASGRRVTDLGSGLNVFGRGVFQGLALGRYADDLRFNCYLLLGLIDARRSFMFFPIHWAEEDQVSNVKIVSQSLNTLKILLQYLFTRRAFRTAEHRATPRGSYHFNTLGTNPALEQLSATQAHLETAV